MNEGYIKFTVRLTPGDVAGGGALDRLNAFRTELYDLGLIGIYPGNIGYGNVSLRDGADGAFLITGTATGAKRVLSLSDYCRVTSFDPVKNEVLCTGRVRASSESMSHGVIYQALPETGCVAHVHSSELFRFMLAHGFPRTPESAAFGTPEMAYEISRQVRARGASRGVFAMAGHEDGVIAYGQDVDATRDVLLKVLAQREGGIS